MELPDGFFAAWWWTEDRRWATAEVVLDLAHRAPVADALISQMAASYGWGAPRLKALLDALDADGSLQVTWADPERRTRCAFSFGTFLGASAARPTPSDEVPAMFELWRNIVAGGQSRFVLTQRREQVLRAVLNECLRDHDEPLAVFDSMMGCVADSDYHMASPAYRTPESLFRNRERRQRWYVAGLDRITKRGVEDRRWREIVAAADKARGPVRDTGGCPAHALDVDATLAALSESERRAVLDEARAAAEILYPAAGPGDDGLRPFLEGVLSARRST